MNDRGAVRAVSAETEARIAHASQSLKAGCQSCPGTASGPGGLLGMREHLHVSAWLL